MPFSLLYPDGLDPRCHAAHLALYLQGWAEGLDIPRIEIDLQGLDRLCAELAHPDFPHVDGLEQASPFKKVGNFFVWCIHHKPVSSPLPADLVGAEITKLPNHQNVFFAYHFATACLENATLIKRDGSEAKLVNRIRISDHSLCDLIDTFGSIVPYQHFKPVCLLFEQMAYKANPGVSYEEKY